MQNKFFNALLILTSLIGYLEWGGNNHIFLFQAEAKILESLFTNPASVLHPFTILPLIAQVLLAITLFQKQPNKFLTYAGIVGLSLLLLLMFIIGLMTLNYTIICFTLPFLLTAGITIYYSKKKNV